MPTPTSGSQDRPSSTNQSSGTSSCPHIRPWVRYGARLFDLVLFCNILLSLITACGLDITKYQMLSFFLASLLMPLSLPVEAFLISHTGTTPGKWLLKTSIIKENGMHLSYLESLKRSAFVWIKGFALYIPFALLVANFFAYREIRKSGRAPWDKDKNIVVHKKIGAIRIFLLICSFILLVFFQDFLQVEPSETRALKWSEVSEKPEFQALPIYEKEAARWQYFDEVIRPQVKETELEEIRSQFDADTKLESSEENNPKAKTPHATTKGMLEIAQYLENRAKACEKGRLSCFMHQHNIALNPSQKRTVAIAFLLFCSFCFGIGYLQSSGSIVNIAKDFLQKTLGKNVFPVNVLRGFLRLWIVFLLFCLAFCYYGYFAVYDGFEYPLNLRYSVARFVEPYNFYDVSFVMLSYCITSLFLWALVVWVWRGFIPLPMVDQCKENEKLLKGIDKSTKGSSDDETSDTDGNTKEPDDLESRAKRYHDQIDVQIESSYNFLLRMFGRDNTENSAKRYSLKTISVFAVHIATLIAIKRGHPQLHRSTLNGFTHTLSFRTPNTMPNIEPPKNMFVSYCSDEESFMHAQTEIFEQQGVEPLVRNLLQHLGGKDIDYKSLFDHLEYTARQIRGTYLPFLTR